MIENKELTDFYTDIQEEITSLQIAEEEGATPEQIFTDIALEYLSEANETENYRICYDEKISRRGVVHKVNAYSLYEDYQTLDLFITIYYPNDDIQSVTKADMEKAFNRLSKFFNNAINNSYVNEIEESSEIFDLAHTLAKVSDIKEYLTRVNVFLITNGEVKADPKVKDNISGFPVFYRVIDIYYLFNLSVKPRIPIEIDFAEIAIPLPCITSNVELEGYQSYLAIIPGTVLAHIYEQYGSRLLEQNVRSFLQFTGKINKGIRNTIVNEPHMFLAFNNGIAATAEEVRLIDNNGGGMAIAYVKDFQIVNGGQTTAAIYHALKKYNADITNVYVQIKLTTIRNAEMFGITVARIAEYANTQNKISISDLSSNKEGLVMLEHLSRITWAPPKTGENHQTRWFFERARGQYKNERIRQGISHSKRKAFDIQNPRSQMFTKELLAKYLNSYQEIYNKKKLVIGPYHVVRGSQKNYVQFLLYNYENNPDERYFQDSVAKAILFKSAEKVYGIGQNAIGDMRYITVPYMLAWLNQKISYGLDLYSVWKAQSLPNDLIEEMYNLMVQIEDFIKTNAPGALYGEWAKKEDCWLSVREQDFDCDFKIINKYVKHGKDDPGGILNQEEFDEKLKKQKLDEITKLGAENWKKIYLWAKSHEDFPLFYTNLAHNIGKKLRDKLTLSAREIFGGSMVLEEVVKRSNLLQSLYDESEEESE